MFYTKKYPITHLESQFLTAEWEKGYKNTKIFYGDDEIGSVDSVHQLKKGRKFNHPHLGLIELKLSEKPITLDIVINGLHSSVNQAHPEKKIKSISIYFYMFAAFALLYTVLQLVSTNNMQTVIFTLATELPFILLYVLCAIFAKKSQVWAVYTGFIVFCVFTLLSLLALITLPGLIPFITILIRAAFVVFMAPYLKVASELPNYKKFKKYSNQNLLDDI